MTSTPCEKTSGGDNSKLVENRTKQHVDDDYLPISEFYKGRSIFITGGEFLLPYNFSQYFIHFLTYTRRKWIYGKSPRGEVTTIMSRN